MRKSVKENITLPSLIKKSSLELNKDTEVKKPRLKRIFYSPMVSPARFQQKVIMLESMMNNKNYDDVKDEKKEKQIQTFLRETNLCFLNRDDKSKNLVGRQAQMKYYENYKRLDKIVNRKKALALSDVLYSIQQDASTTVLQQVQNLGVLPCCMGIVKPKGDLSVISVKGQKFGDKYVKAISAGLKQSKLIQNCQFSNNRLTDKGFDQIINNLSNEIIRLDFSHNSITKMNQVLLNKIIQPEARLQYLNLQNNLLSDKAVQALCRSSSYSKHLKYLNVRKNLLTKNCAQGISQLILRTLNLEELYIGVNRINQQGAISVLESLQENRTIRVFDYCMSKLGESVACAKAIANVIAVNKILVHVDFSGNNFNLQQSKIISEKLHDNKKIYGFHFNGNFGFVDSKGFLKVQKKNMTSLHSIVQRHISSYEIVFRREAVSSDPTSYKNVCWICQGWHEHTFKFTVPEPSPDGKNFLYIHFDFEQFEPRLINISETKVKYKCMVPPRKYGYFFTWKGQQFLDHAVVSTSHHLANQNQQEQVIQKRLQFPLKYTYEMNHEQVSFQVNQISCRSCKPKKVVNNWDQLILSVLPRQQGLVNKKQKKPWSFKDSLWSKQWKLDDDQFTKNCFEKDWKCSKLSNFIKNQTEQQKVKQLLYKDYKLIKQLYRYYSSWSPFNGDIWAVSNNAFTDFCHQAKIISKDTPLKIIDLTFITTNSISGADYKGNSLVPERGQVRFQFMEAIVRLAEQKFKKNGLSDSILGSVQNILKDHIQPLSNNSICNNQKWRLQKYFIEQNDMLVKKYRAIFTQIYKKNSKMKVKPGNKPFMCLGEFRSIIQRIGIAGTLVLQRDLFLSFNCSMMTQIDQLQNQRFIRMTQIQFIQAIARCAFILPNTCKVQDIFGPVIPFHAKFEWIIHQLKSLCSEELKNSFSVASSLFNKSEED